MRCPSCGSIARVKKGVRYQFVESGLSNAFLEGIEQIDCRACGEHSPLIPRMSSLLATIGKTIVFKPFPLTGEELRFLRKQAGYSTKAWAELLGVNKSVLSRWENEKVFAGAQSDRLVRLVYLMIMLQKGEVVIDQRSSEKIAEIIAERPSTEPVIVVPNRQPFRAGYDFQGVKPLALP